MRYYPETEEDRAEAAVLNAEPWMLECLKANPSFCGWGPGEGHMRGIPVDRPADWTDGLIFDCWPAFGPMDLDDSNEVVDYHFEVSRDSAICHVCGGNGYHPNARTQRVVNTFSADMNPDGIAWQHDLEQDETDELIAKGRLRELTHDELVEEGEDLEVRTDWTAAEVNAWTRGAHIHLSPIDRWIVTEVRLKRLGLPVFCPECGGKGYVFVAENAQLALVLWVIHPRYGASRGWVVRNLLRSELVSVKLFLRDAAERNRKRFVGIGRLSKLEAKGKVDGSG